MTRSETGEQVPKNIVICLDGTGGQLRARANSNAVLLFQILDLDDPERQVGYYDPGVGTFSSPGAWTPLGRWLTRLLGLAFGLGLRANLGEAYLFLMRTYQPGDRIYLFGFSRGAFTARALAGLLRSVGLLRPGSENLVQYAVSSYTKRKARDEDWEELAGYARIFSVDLAGKRAVPIEFMGIWDCVKAAGLLRGSVTWPWTRRLPNVARVRHAVSIDERRRAFREYLVQPRGKRPVLEEVWFAGVHSDVGGTFDDDAKLSSIALKWISEGAVDAGLAVQPDAYAAVRSVTEEFALGTVHPMGRLWTVLGTRRRPLPAAAAVHRSVRRRIEADPNYAPRIPDDATWVDEDWAVSRSSR